jgi:hypothetical protein
MKRVEDVQAKTNSFIDCVLCEERTTFDAIFKRVQKRRDLGFRALLDATTNG